MRIPMNSFTPHFAIIEKICNEMCDMLAKAGLTLSDFGSIGVA
jgi:hypothetical protein